VQVALEIIIRGSVNSSRVALFPGAWNPPTIAHIEIARAALQWADEVVWVLPRVFPHKSFDDVDFDARRRMLELIATSERGFSVAVSDGGLYAEIAAEAVDAYPSAEIALACGRDAAERIASWDYGQPGVFDEMVRRHRLLVAGRAGEYGVPEKHRDRILNVLLPPEAHGVSSSEVRRLIREGLAWEHLVPACIVEAVRDIYWNKMKGTGDKIAGGTVGEKGKHGNA
jgi:nicotinic acid mononucleotide adenylyltransferase